MEQAAKATISLSPSYAGCCMAACPYRSTRHLRRGGGCSARSISSLRHAPSARVYAAAAATPEPKSTKENDLVFIAGATGKVGSRAVRPAAERLEIVECDLEKQAQSDIVSAIGNAAIVVCSIGASEKDILDVTGPYRIDYMATNNLVQAATAAKVEHFTLVTSLGTNRIGFPAFLLNLFWGVLCWKRRAEEALIGSGLPYTIVRPGGMERPTDAFKETHNLVVAVEDTYVGGLVSNLQVAELIACIASNRRTAYCKVVEAIAETTAPLLPTEDQLANIPSKRICGPEASKLAIAVPTISSSSCSYFYRYRCGRFIVNVELQRHRHPHQRGSTEAAAEASFTELKPPSSPSPTPPSAASSASVSACPDTPPAAAASSAALDSSANGTPITGDQLNQQQRPLSPYTRYEELKPPSSPTPSTPKL
uniref:NAD(P)-binding domain-containing protein n=1 Tax=Oryza glumipatula TaxID=40148 RepID=A0A0E0B6Z8_9ORYZ